MYGNLPISRLSLAIRTLFQICSRNMNQLLESFTQLCLKSMPRFFIAYTARRKVLCYPQLKQKDQYSNT